MNILGFTFTKLHAERKPEFKARTNKETNIEFLDVKNDESSLIKADAVYSILFKYTVNYLDAEAKKPSSHAEIAIEGRVIISLDKLEDKEFTKSWKKKEMGPRFKEILFNFLLKKCTPRALDLEDHINIPSHIPVPQIRIEPPKEKD
jgi:hypothetical protein